MLNINFVPDDYVQNNESRRTNFLCLVLFVVVMAGLGGAFATIKIRQRACMAKEQLVNDRIARVQQAIKQFDELQAKRKEMMKTALTTAELLEPVPRSILLASLTNNLPPGVSLVSVELVQKKPRNVPHPVPTSKFKKTQAQKSATPPAPSSPEKMLETTIDIGGIAPTDLQVAAYIERLSNSNLLENVALVESREYKVEETTFRQFKLKAKLKKDIHLTRQDVERIRAGATRSVHRF